MDIFLLVMFILVFAGLAVWVFWTSGQKKTYSVAPVTQVVVDNPGKRPKRRRKPGKWFHGRRYSRNARRDRKSPGYRPVWLENLKKSRKGSSNKPRAVLMAERRMR